MGTKVKYKDWTLIDWDGNTELGYKCWRKSFGRGHVSVGVGDFNLIVFSHGANSDESLSSCRVGGETEKDAMKIVDSNKGFYKSKHK